MAKFVLPARSAAPERGVLQRVADFLFRTWPGKLLLAALAVRLWQAVGLPLPEFLAVLDVILLCVLGAYAFFRMARVVLRGLLWRIRTKLILSYLFIGLVPLVLAAMFFVIAGILLVNLVAVHIVNTQVDRMTATLATVAEAAWPGLPESDAAAAKAIVERLAPARALHPKLTFSLVRKGKVVAREGEAPVALPAWWTGESFAGFLAGRPGSLRAVRGSAADTFLLLDAPVDEELFLPFERETGIHVLTDPELQEGDDGEARRERRRRALSLSASSDSGFAFMAFPARTDWESGAKGLIGPLPFRFQPFELAKRLSPGFKIGERGNLAGGLVYAMGAVGAVFLVVYGVALVLGLLLARSITRSVHSLSVGTLKLQQGDFGHRIAMGSRDQLGELAESFNHMSRGIQDLLRERGEKERLEEELRIARQIQMSLLPAQGSVTVPGLRVAGLCIPAAEVGGDYYDLLPLSDTRLGVLVADVSGKGTSAALYMAELKGLVLSLSRIYASPAKLLAEANRILGESMDSRSFITMTYAVLDTAEATMRYARAGHNPIIHLEAASGRTRVLSPAGLGLGIDPGPKFEAILEEAVIPLHRDDVFLFFTDGLSEAMNGQSELFGEGRLRSIIESAEGRETDEIKDEILAEIRSFVGTSAPHDDMTLVVLKVA